MTRDFFYYPDDDSDERAPLDLDTFYPPRCALCPAPAYQNVVMFPQSRALKQAVLTMRTHPVPKTTAETGLVCGICEQHARDLPRTFEALEKQVFALARKVRWQ